MVRKLVMWGLVLCVKHSILIISHKHRLRFARTSWDNFESYTWTLVISDGCFEITSWCKIGATTFILACEKNHYLKNIKSTLNVKMNNIPPMCIFFSFLVDQMCLLFFLSHILLPRQCFSSVNFSTRPVFLPCKFFYFVNYSTPVIILLS